MLATIFSPARIRILLHCHTIPDPLPNWDSPMVAGVLNEFKKSGVIEQTTHNCYVTTPLGRAWVNALFRVEMPRPAFIDEQGRVLDHT